MLASDWSELVMLASDWSELDSHASHWSGLMARRSERGLEGNKTDQPEMEMSGMGNRKLG